MSGVAVVLFSDLVDSTALLAQLGDDRMEEIRRAHIEDVSAAVGTAGGRLVKSLGDGAMASFKSALGALRAAAAIQAAVERLDAAQDRIGIAARVGVAAGEPIADGDDLHGMAVVIASRLSGAAGTGEVLVQDLVANLVASRDGIDLDGASEYELKGVGGPVRASKLRWRELAEVMTASASSGAPHRPAGEARRNRVRLPPRLAAYVDEPLIGRDGEVSALRKAIAAGKSRQAVLVLGEPGIGKTRHAAAAAADAHALGSLVVFARCSPEAVIPFEPWVRAIGELARSGDDAWRRSLAAAAGSELSMLVPALRGAGEEPAGAEAGAVAAAEGARYRVLHGIGAVLGHAAGGAPLHVVLDDAHWCDPASAQALEHLLDGSQEAPLVLVVTAREREMGRAHPISRALLDLRRTGDLSELRLGGLDADGLAALVAARVGRAITPGLAARLQVRTAGNPFFATELARELDQKGALRDGEELHSTPVPEAVADLVEERLARLDPLAERFLVAAATIGPTAQVDLAARAAGISAEDAERAVSEALEQRLVDEVPGSRPAISFHHTLIREALTAGLDEAARGRLHLGVANALEEQPEPEPAELALHCGRAVSWVGPERAIAAYEAAARAAATGHDHEQAASHLRAALDLIGSDPAVRAPLLLELGEQELLAADLSRAREAFRGALDAARITGDGVLFAQAALGFAGGDISFGIETNSYDRAAVDLLREGLSALGDDEPRLSLRMSFRLSFALIFSDEDEALAELARRAQELAALLDDPEADLLWRGTELLVMSARSPDPLTMLDHVLPATFELVELAETCNREDLRFRFHLWSAHSFYSLGRIDECEASIERAASIAERLASPRFGWEIDLVRGQRRLDRGDRAGAVDLFNRAGRTLRRLRPDLQIGVELLLRVAIGWIYDDEPGTDRIVFDAVNEIAPWGLTAALTALGAARAGDYEAARQRMETLLDGDLDALRRPDNHLPPALCFLSYAATLAGDRKAGARLRPLLEPLRPYLVSATPTVSVGFLPGWQIGRLELLAGNAEAAVEELRAAVAKADACELVWLSAAARVDLAIALHRRGADDGGEEALAVLAEGEEIGRRHGIHWVENASADARALLDGVETPPPSQPGERRRPVRALGVRGGRRALAAMARGQDDVALEQRFSDRRLQRALVRAMARGFQPADAGGFRGIIAFELEPFAVEAPPEAPWRWAIEVDSAGGRAGLLEPAPLDAAVTIHIGLAEWVRVTAGLSDPLTAMAAGRCSVEGDVVLAARLEAMFGG